MKKVKQNGGNSTTGNQRRGKFEANIGVPGGIRTHDPLLRRQPLCPLSYRDSD